MSLKIQLRRGTSHQWSTTNPVLAEGEMGYELDTNKLKIGDGVKTWLQLVYLVSGSGGGSFDLTALSPLNFNSNTNVLSLDELSVVLDGLNF